MAKYTCDTCGREFNQKGHFTRHCDKKNPCVQGQKKKLGQYFTVSKELQDFVFQKVQHKGELLLEPSFGAGHLLQPFKAADPNYPMICYELDNTISPVVTFNPSQTIVYGDFTKQTITRKFKTIVGNPPYVKQSTGNLYIRFIEICFGLLEDGGELIFIVPSDFLKLTSASSLIDTMAKEGCFTDFLFPNNEKLFEGASIDVVVFRYEKGRASNETVKNGRKMFYDVHQGILTFREEDVQGVSLSSLFSVYVGIVSGRDAIYKQAFGNIRVLEDKDRVETYIYTESFPTSNEIIDAHLRAHKDELMGRKIRKFNEQNWFEWGAPRNKKSVEAAAGKPCIYVRTMTRKKEVAFVGNVQYFGGALLCMIPRAEMSADALDRIVTFLNTEAFQNEYIYSGRFKIGHKQLCNVVVPH